MARYRVYLPAPKAKRMRNGRQVSVERCTGGIAPHTFQDIYDIPDDATHVDFEMGNRYTPWHQRNPNIMDGPATFRIFLVCHNSTKTRSETIELVPEKL